MIEVYKIILLFLKISSKFHLTFGFREVSNEVRNLDGACKAESLNPCYTFFLQEKIVE